MHIMTLTQKNEQKLRREATVIGELKRKYDC